MKGVYLILSFLITITLSGFGQNDEDAKNDGGRLQAYKIAFLTKKLNLSPEEAQSFWPVYNKYEDEIRSVRRENRQKPADELGMEEKILNIRKKYNNEFSKVLPTEKVNTLFRSEKEFSNIVQREMLERRQQQQDRKQRIKEK